MKTGENMKKIIYIWCCLLLCMFVPVLKVCAEDTGEIQDIESEVESIQIPAEVYVNPIYEELEVEADLIPEIGFYTDVEPEYLTTQEAVVELFRETLENRLSSITVYYASEESLPGNWLEIWLNQAYEETDKPTQGDYIHYNFQKVIFSGATAYKKDGIYYYPLPLTFIYLSDRDQELQVTAQVNVLISEFAFTSDTADEEKIKTIYDWVCSNVTYDYEHLNDEAYALKHSTYAALIDRTCVCQGYATLMYRLLRETGISTRVITGTSNGVGHAWNIVKIGDYYYNLDATWDAGMSEYTYYLKSDSDFGDHVRKSDFATEGFYQKYPMAENSYISGDHSGEDETYESYRITYIGTGAENVPEEQIKRQGKNLVLSMVYPEKAGINVTFDMNMDGKDAVMTVENSAEFLGWNTREDGNGRSYQPGDIYSEDQDITLYAQWNEQRFEDFSRNMIIPGRNDYEFVGWYTKASNGEQIKSDTVVETDQTVYARWKRIYKDDVEAFVGQLYNVCLNRDPDNAGLDLWTDLLKSRTYSGVTTAHGFIFSSEFINKNLCNDDFVEQLYMAFMGRPSDDSGKATWVSLLEDGKTREEVFNGFALSPEFKRLCESYGIVQGEAIEIPVYGTIAKGNCDVCGAEDGVTGFVKRLYQICLNRMPDQGGLDTWTKLLWNQEGTGRSVAHGFVFSPEFVNKHYTNEEYVEYLYEAFMGRSSDAAGKAMWVELLKKGSYTREEVFDGFAGSAEFAKICKRYGILRD